MTFFAERVEATKSMETVGMRSWLALVAIIASIGAREKIYRLALVKTIFHAREGMIPSEWCAKRVATSSKISLIERTEYNQAMAIVEDAMGDLERNGNYLV